MRSIAIDGPSDDVTQPTAPPRPRPRLSSTAASRGDRCPARPKAARRAGRPCIRITPAQPNAAIREHQEDDPRSIAGRGRGERHRIATARTEEATIQVEDAEGDVRSARNRRMGALPPDFISAQGTISRSRCASIQRRSQHRRETVAGTMARARNHTEDKGPGGGAATRRTRRAEGGKGDRGKCGGDAVRVQSAMTKRGVLGGDDREIAMELCRVRRHRAPKTMCRSRVK